MFSRSPYLALLFGVLAPGEVESGAEFLRLHQLCVANIHRQKDRLSFVNACEEKEGFFTGWPHISRCHEVCVSPERLSAEASLEEFDGFQHEARACSVVRVQMPLSLQTGG